jgi:hypothetical protein
MLVEVFSIFGFLVKPCLAHRSLDGLQGEEQIRLLECLKILHLKMTKVGTAIGNGEGRSRKIYGYLNIYLLNL